MDEISGPSKAVVRSVAAAAGLMSVGAAMPLREALHPEWDSAYWLGYVTPPVLIGVFIGIAAGGSVRGWWRLAIAGLAPPLVAAAWLTFQFVGDLAQDLRGRNAPAQVSSAPDAAFATPETVMGYERVDNERTRRTADQAVERASKLDVIVAYAEYASGPDSFAFVGLTPTNQRDQMDDPAQGVADYLAGAGIKDADSFNPGIRGVAMQCARLRSGVVCAFADRYGVGSIGWTLTEDPSVQRASILTSRVIPDFRIGRDD